MNIDAFVCIASFASKELLTGLALNGSFCSCIGFSLSAMYLNVSLQVTNASETSVAFMADNNL